MVSYWDTSAVVPLLTEEPTTAAMRRKLAMVSLVWTWWGTEVECISAIARKSREGLPPDLATAATETLAIYLESWDVVEPSQDLKTLALRLVRVHGLRAADALQLAAAGIVAEGNAEGIVFITQDRRLADAAEREGFRLAFREPN
ncbi:MAG: type II toxin-antitoxin system VapC family toxin [Terriglobales bacterium]